MQSFIFNRLFDGLLSSGGNAAEGHRTVSQRVDVGGVERGSAQARVRAGGW